MSPQFADFTCLSPPHQRPNRAKGENCPIEKLRQKGETLLFQPSGAHSGRYEVLLEIAPRWVFKNSPFKASTQYKLSRELFQNLATQRLRHSMPVAMPASASASAPVFATPEGASERRRGMPLSYRNRAVSWSHGSPKDEGTGCSVDIRQSDTALI